MLTWSSVNSVTSTDISITQKKQKSLVNRKDISKTSFFFLSADGKYTSTLVSLGKGPVPLQTTSHFTIVWATYRFLQEITGRNPSKPYVGKEMGFFVRNQRKSITFKPERLTNQQKTISFLTYGFDRFFHRENSESIETQVKDSAIV